jgi:hypothetical protein
MSHLSVYIYCDPILPLFIIYCFGLSGLSLQILIGYPIARNGLVYESDCGASTLSCSLVFTHTMYSLLAVT